MDSRDYITQQLRDMGFTVPESKSNFIFAGANAKLPAKEYFAKLRENAILVRYFDAPRTREYVRITIGTQQQMETLAAVTNKLLQEKE